MKELKAWVKAQITVLINTTDLALPGSIYEKSKLDCMYLIMSKIEEIEGKEV